jgi:stage III sporulation protein AE
LKKIFCFVLCTLLFVSVSKERIYSYAETQSSSEVLSELEENIGSQLGNLDFSSLDNILADMTDSQKNIFGSGNFLDKVKMLLDGRFDNTYDNFFEYIINLLFDDVLEILPSLCMIVAISIVCSFLGGMSSSENKGVSHLIYFICFGVVVVMILSSTKGLVNDVSQVLNVLKVQMDVIFPIILTLITSIGSVVTVSVFQPAIALLSAGIMNIFNAVMIPIFLFSIIFCVVGNMSNSIKLDKCSKFCSSLFKWIIGVIFTVFIAFLSIQGITAASVDGISIRTAKFALKSYIPLLGGYLSDGFNLIVASSVLIKNAVGATGLILMIVTIIVPVIKIGIYSLGLKLVAAIVEPLSDNKIANFLYGVSKSLNMLIACVVGVGFMYLTTVGLLMCMSNIV